MSKPTPPGRPRDPDIDDAIVDATRALIAEGGLPAVSMTAVAERAGVTRPTVYRRFPDATALVLSVLYRDLGRVAARALADTSPQLPFRDQVLGLFEPILRYYATSPQATLAMLQLAMFRPPGAGGPDTEQQLMDYLAELVQRGVLAIERGELAAHTDLLALVMTCFSVYLMTALAGAHGAMALDDQLASFRRSVDQLLGGVRA